MKYVTHNQNDQNEAFYSKFNGTYRIGNIQTTYARLVEKFGQPIVGEDGDKVDAEWLIQFEDGTVATIYNWKNGKCYNGDDGLPVEEIIDWNIGGFSFSTSVDLIKMILNI
jgi:hypothetical protein